MIDEVTKLVIFGKLLGKSDILEEAKKMGLPESPLDKMKLNGELLNEPQLREPEIFKKNMQLFDSTCTYLSYGAAVFYITLHQNSMRGFDDITFKKVLSNLERSRYIAGIVLQSLDGFEEEVNKQKEYKKRWREHVSRKKEQDTQNNLISKMLNKKLYKKQKINRTRESKLDILKITGNDFLRQRKVNLDTGVRFTTAPKTRELEDQDKDAQLVYK